MHMAGEFRRVCAGVLGVGAVLVSVIGGCPPMGGDPNGDPNEPGGTTLVRFTSGDELLQYFRRQATAARSSGGTPLGDLFGGMFGVFGAAAAPEATGGNGETGGATEDESFSTTNLQELGVDESDVFKSDGAYFYVAKGRTVRIIRAVPPSELTEVARLELEDYVDSLYLNDDRLLVLGTRFESGGTIYGAPEIMIWPPYYTDGFVSVTAFNVSDPAAPVKAEAVELEGSLASSRLTNGRLILVLTHAPPLPENPTPLAVAGLTLDDVLPKVRTEAGEAFAVSVESWYRPESPEGYFTSTVVTLDAAKVDSIVGSVAVMAQAETIYASTEAAYFVSSDYSASNGPRTVVHKFKYNQQGVAEYTASGPVPGYLFNQFSLGEHQGYLRVVTQVENFVMGGDTPVGIAVGGGSGSSGVATTTVEPQQAQARQGPYSAVYVLGESAGTLNIVGQIEDIAPGETLRAARFMGGHGFLVTYRQVDPLFVLDLSNPTAPAILGELKIPGFSEYLHPVDETHLIGVGKATTQMPNGGELVGGVQVSLFDVSNWAAPRAVQQIELGGRGSSSDVEYTHKALVYMPETNLLAIPVSLMPEQEEWYGTPVFDGVLALKVDKNTGFTELGRIPSVVYDEWGWVDWRRPAVIGNTLYALTSAGVRAADMGNFGQTWRLILTPAEGEISGGGSSPGWPGEPAWR